MRFPILALILACGCSNPSSLPELVWGRHGVQDGDLARPRAVAIDKQDRLFIVDFTARIQVFDRDGKFLDHCWRTPDYRNGRPSGLSMDRDGNLLVSDSHYHCLRIYSTEGDLLRTLEGDFSYVSDALQDEDGFYYVSEFGENQRISKLDPDGKLIKSWGSPGTEPGQFARIRAMTLGPDRNLFVADVNNHRIQIFSREGDLVAVWGKDGTGPGELAYPYDLAFNKKGELYVVEFGNHRVQKFSVKGESLGCWGGRGREPGQLNSPWALAVDSKSRVHVIDTENHRVQRVDF